jgi:hypothetical protein
VVQRADSCASFRGFPGESGYPREVAQRFASRVGFRACLCVLAIAPRHPKHELAIVEGKVYYNDQFVGPGLGLAMLACTLAMLCFACAGGAERARGTLDAAPPPAASVTSATPEVRSGPKALAEFPAWFGAGELRVAGGKGGLARAVVEILDSIAELKPTTPVEVAFVIDASIPQGLEASLALALARYRLGPLSRESAPSLPVLRGARYALVVASGQSDGWRARVAAPFQEDLFGLGIDSVRAARSTYPFHEQGIGAVWSGLRAATGLPWSQGSTKHVILLSDDRRDCERASERETFDCAYEEPEQRKWRNRGLEMGSDVARSVRAWARAQRAALHVIHCQLEYDDDNLGKGEYHPGTDLDWIARLFRRGSSVDRVDSAGLVTAIERALDAASVGSRSEVDVVLLVRERGVMGEQLPVLKSAAPLLRRFLETPGRRLGLVRWTTGAKPFSIGSKLTADARLFSAAVEALRAGPIGNTPASFWPGLELARGLGLRPAASKAMIVLSSPHAVRGVDYGFVLWAETESVAITFITPR